MADKKKTTLAENFKNKSQAKSKGPEIEQEFLERIGEDDPSGNLPSYKAGRVTEVAPDKDGHKKYVERVYDFKAGTVTIDTQWGYGTPQWGHGDLNKRPTVTMPIAQADKTVQAEAAELKAKVDALPPKVTHEEFVGKDFFHRTFINAKGDSETHLFDFKRKSYDVNVPGADGKGGTTTWVTGKDLNELNPEERKEMAGVKATIAKYRDTAVLAGGAKAGEAVPADPDAPRPWKDIAAENRWKAQYTNRGNGPGGK